jgi:hypothetical protein
MSETSSPPRRLRVTDVQTPSSAKRAKVSFNKEVMVLLTLPGIVLVSVVKEGNRALDGFSNPVYRKLRGNPTGHVDGTPLQLGQFVLFAIANRVSARHRNEWERDGDSGFSRKYYAALSDNPWDDAALLSLAERVRDVSRWVNARF